MRRRTGEFFQPAVRRISVRPGGCGKGQPPCMERGSAGCGADSPGRDGIKEKPEDARAALSGFTGRPATPGEGVWI